MIAGSELLQGKSHVAFSSDPKTLVGYRELAEHMGATVTTKTEWRPTLDGIELRPQPTRN
ncbi:MAG TPA: hypothetical protein VGJ20_14420 [Xanthobacteraceae bacterium]